MMTTSSWMSPDFCAVHRFRGNRQTGPHIFTWAGVNYPGKALLRGGSAPWEPADRSYKFIASHLAQDALTQSPLGEIPLVFSLQLDPERELTYQFGPVQVSEMEMIFRPNMRSVEIGRSFSAAIKAVGAVFLVRIHQNGLVESIPFSIAPDPHNDILQLADRAALVSFLQQPDGNGFYDQTTGTILVDLHRLDLYETLRTAPEHHRGIFEDTLFSHINRHTGGAIEKEFLLDESSISPRAEICDILDLAAYILRTQFRASWSLPASKYGRERLGALHSDAGQLPADDQDLAHALFNLLADTPSDSSLVLPSATREPQSPWNPRKQKAGVYTSKARSAHAMTRIAAMARERFISAQANGETQRSFLRLNGEQMSDYVMQRLNRFFSVG